METINETALREFTERSHRGTVGRFFVEIDGINQYYVQSIREDINNRIIINYPSYVYSLNDPNNIRIHEKYFIEKIGNELDNDIKVHILDATGKIIYTRVYDGCIINSVQLCDLDYASDRPSDIAITFTYMKRKIETYGKDNS